MVKFAYDPVIYPIESSWFGQLNEDGKIVKMEETDIYKEDRFGLQTLHQSGRLFAHNIKGVHLEFKDNHI